MSKAEAIEAIESLGKDIWFFFRLILSSEIAASTTPNSSTNAALES
jgi:hypothetical protein